MGASHGRAGHLPTGTNAPMTAPHSRDETARAVMGLRLSSGGR